MPGVWRSWLTLGLALAVGVGCASSGRTVPPPAPAANPPGTPGADSDALRARIAVTRFALATTGAPPQLGDVVAVSFARVLARSGRHLVLDRLAPADWLFAGGAALPPEAAGYRAVFASSDLALLGTIVVLEVGGSGIGAGSLGQVGNVVGSLAGVPLLSTLTGLLNSAAGSSSLRSVKLGVDLKLLETGSGRTVAETRVEGQSSAMTSGTPPADAALLAAAGEAVRWMLQVTPAELYRHRDWADAFRPPPLPGVAAAPTSTATAPATPVAAAPAGPEAAAIAFVRVPVTTLRAEPTETARAVALAGSGARLRVLEVRNGWFRARLDDGREGWVAESVTALEPPVASPASGAASFGPAASELPGR